MGAEPGLVRKVQAEGTAALEGCAPARPGSTSRGRGPLLSDGSIAQTAFSLGTLQPPAITLLQVYLGPCVTVATLAACVWIDRVQYSSQLLAIALIAFLLARSVLTTPGLRLTARGKRELRPTLARLLLEWSCVFAVLTFLLTLLHQRRWIGNGALAAWYFIAPAALMASNFAVSALPRWWTARRSCPARHIIIGATDAGLELAKRVEQGSYAGKFLGFFDFRDPSRLPRLAPDQWVGTCARVAEFVERNAVDSIYIALPISSTPRFAELLGQLRDTTASIYFVPANIFAFELIQPRCVEINGIPALAVRDTPHSGMSGLRKRLFDIVMALFGLSLAAPLMLAVAVAIKLTSKGPVFFTQRRYGLRGEGISIYKFRTMTVCEDGAAVTQVTRDDQRITPLGRFLRRTSLDELPQIVNVLEGKMSLVGPRPHAVAHNEQYRKLISGYMIRHKVRPGITGWAQVNGLRGETDTLDKMRRRVEYDIDYLSNWSLWLDMKILLRTARIVLGDDRAY